MYMYVCIYVYVWGMAAVPDLALPYTDRYVYVYMYTYMYTNVYV